MRCSYYHGLPLRFARAESWKDLENALTYSPLNRGADSLVFLSLRTRTNHPPFIKGVKTVSYTSVVPELAQLLSFSGPTKPSANVLDPKAEPYVPPVQPPALAHNEDGAVEVKQASGQSEADAFADLLPSGSQIDYISSMENPQNERALTIGEMGMGRKILFCYRRYALRQRVKARRAIRIIWAYYSRYRLCHKALQTATGDRIRKLYNDYTQDLESIVYPLLIAKGFHRHRRIMLGYMPHVAVYIRGLDDINQQQKDANKKRLQKVQHEELEQLQFNMDVCR